MRLIDANVLKEELTSHFDLELEPVIEKEVLRMIDEQETILVKPPKWISVKDRLPEKGTDVIANSKICGVTPAFYDNDGTYYDLNGDGVRGVTHWMPLPEPPEVEDVQG